MLGPSLKVTVPVGVPAPVLRAFTVAVKVTDCPDTDWLCEELTPVVVPGSVVVVVVVVVDVVVVLVGVGKDVVVVLVGVGVVVVVEGGLGVVVAAPAGRKVPSGRSRLWGRPKVRCPCGRARTLE